MKNIKYMKTGKILTVGVGLILMTSACGNSNGDYDASGIFEATEVVVSAKGNGEIKKFDVEEGQIFDANVLLGYIDTTQLYLTKEQLLAGKKSIGNRQTDVNQQVASIRQQIETQKKEKARFESLVRSNAATQKQVDDIDAQIKVLQKQLSAQVEVLSNTNSSISNESQGMEIQVAQIEDQIQNSLIKSPIKGTVLSKYAEQGEFATMGKALLKMADIENMKLRVYITADQLTAIKIGQDVKVYADQGEADRKEYPGKIIWISDKAEFTPKTIQTRDERANLVYAVKVAVKNDGYIKKGMYGEVKL